MQEFIAVIVVEKLLRIKFLINLESEKKMIEVGRLCFKVAGREAGKPCLIVDVIDDKFVLIDGVVRRKRCNIIHLQFTPIVFKIKKKASTEEVIKSLVDNKIILAAPKKGVKPKKKAAEKVKPIKKKIIKPKKEKKVTKKKVVAKKVEKKTVSEKKTVAKKAPVKKKAAKKKVAKKKK